jgi:hypothetical protein
MIRRTIPLATCAGLLALATACGPAQGQTAPDQTAQRQAAHSQARAAPSGFAWFRPGAAPASWRQASLPRRSGVLSYPSSLRPEPGDPGTMTFGLSNRSGAVLVYLNVTPGLAGETLRDWPGFRAAHLRAAGETSVRADVASGTLAFRGGLGRCVIDDYTTTVHDNHYREIACYVRGAAGAGSASVLIASTRAVTWPQYGALLEQVVNGYTVK